MNRLHLWKEVSGLAGHADTGYGGRRRHIGVVILQIRGGGEQGDDNAERHATDNGQK
jgi:hypothetical protein